MSCAECEKQAKIAQHNGELNKVIAWKAWYTENRVFCSCDVTWSDLPDDGMLCVKIYFAGVYADNKHLSRIMMGDDWYWKVGDIYAHGSNTTVDEINQRYPEAEIKRGKWTTDEIMQKVINTMNEDIL